MNKFNLTIKEGVDYLTLDYEGFRNMMIARLKERLPEYTDYSETDMGIILLELMAHGLDIISYYKDRQSLESFLPTARERKNVITHCKMYGYKLSSATPSKFKVIFRLNDNHEAFSIKMTDRYLLKTKEELSQASVYFEVVGAYDETTGFFKDFEIPAGYYGDEKDVNGNYLFPAHVIQGATIVEEIVGVSTGNPNQKFYTHYSSVLDYIPDHSQEFVVSCKVGETYEEWNRQDNLLFSNNTSKDFTFEVNEYGEGVLCFGNGSSGGIPPKNAKIYLTYRVGGGSNTNVGVDTIQEMPNKFARVSSVTNPETAYSLGTDMETIEEAKVKAPASLRTLYRAVTERDYEDYGLQLKSILSAQSKYLETLTDCIQSGVSSSLLGYMLVWLLPKDPELALTPVKLFSEFDNLNDFTTTNVTLKDKRAVLAGNGNMLYNSANNFSSIYFHTTFNIKDFGAFGSVNNIGFAFNIRHIPNGTYFQVKYHPTCGFQINKIVSNNFDKTLTSKPYDLTLNVDYDIVITCRDNGIRLLVNNEEVLQCVDTDIINKISTGKIGVSTFTECSIDLKSFDTYDYSGTIVHISDDNMKYIRDYYDEGRMIGQKLEIYPAGVEYIAPTILCSRDPNYTKDTVLAGVKAAMNELMALGVYKLNMPLIWSDLVKELVNTTDGVVGLRSAIFVDGQAGGKWYIREDIPAQRGKVFALNAEALNIVFDE